MIKKMKCKLGIVVMAAAILCSTGMSKTVVNAKSETGSLGGATARVTLTDGRSSGTTTAGIQVTNGPSMSLKAVAKIYYAWGTGYYYSTDLVDTYAPSTSISVSKRLGGADVEMCKGNYRITYLSYTWTPSLIIGSLSVSADNYILL